MGEAKRRKQLDANFGNPLHSRGGKANVRHVLASAPPTSADVDLYEAHLREVVQAYEAALVQNAQGARNRLGYSHKEADLCLIAMRTYDNTNQIRMKFARIEQSKRHLIQVLAQSLPDPTQLDRQIDELLRKRSRDEFLWTHADVVRTGIVLRLVPIENAKIARVCHLQTAPGR